MKSIFRFYKNLSIYTKVTMGIIIFTLVLGGVERYQLSQNIINQFFEAKKSKNLLLTNTIAPILGLNISLGLDDANEEYLTYILEENPDVLYIELHDKLNKLLFGVGNEDAKKDTKHTKIQDIDFCYKNITDSTTRDVVGHVYIYFSNVDFQNLKSNNRLLTIKLMIITVFLLFLFVILLRREFEPLERLSISVLAYDPRLNNFSLSTSDKNDEVGVIQNAIVSMVDRISSYTKILDNTNLSLEDKIKERTQELEEANRRLKALSITDELTQLANRRYFEEHFEKTWELARRRSVNISLVMCDIDHFKRINDIYGHQIGDEVLKIIALTLQKSLKRSSDFVARYGGEEFVIVMYDTYIDDAKFVCQRIQQNLQKTQPLFFEETKIDLITMSFGISCVIPDINNKTQSLVRDADNALYEAKEGGRDCIIVHEGCK